MAEPQTIQQQLEAEQAHINSLTDTTEAALRGNALKCKVAALKGESGAGNALVNAQKALDDYLAARDCDGWFRSAREAGGWLSGQGYISNRGNAITADVARKLIETLKKDPKRGYSRRLVVQTADMKWGKPGGRTDEKAPLLQADIDKAYEQSRIARETADKLEFRNQVEKGQYLLKIEVEQQAAASIAFLKQDLLNFGPTVVDLFIEIVSSHLKATGVDLDGTNLTSIAPDLLENYDLRLERWLGRYASAVEL